jgi:YD repeat-containing protein
MQGITMRFTRHPSSALRSVLLASSILLSTGSAIAAATFSYDGLGRLIQVRYDDGKTITYSYDAAGNRTQHVVATSGGANRPPVANADTITMPENQSSITLDPRTNDTDPDSNPIALFSTGNGTLGTSALSNGGTTVTYTSTNKSLASDTFFYVIADGAGGQATGQVTVNFTNQAPTAVNDTIATLRNGSATFDPRGNDSDPGNDALTITAASTPAHGAALILGGGTSLRYTPAVNYYGADSFTYTITDADGATSTATVNATVTYGSAAPVANSDTKTTSMNTAVTFDPRTNDNDPDGGTLTITAKTNGTKGTVTINSGTSLTYTPTTGQTGADSFTYTVSDNDGLTATATVSMTIQAANHAPVANADTLELYGTYETGGTNGSAPTGTIDPRWNDTDQDGNPITITSITQPANATAAINGGGTSITVTRNAVCPGVNPTVGSMTYTISDGQGGTATATITFTKVCENISN